MEAEIRRRGRGGLAGAGRRAIALAVLAVSVVLPAPALAASDGFTGALDVTFDILVLRPTGFITTAVGALLFLPAAFVSSPGGADHINEALDRFVLTPYSFTFERPLGEF